MKIKDIPAVYRRLKADFDQHPSPIVELVKAQTHDPFKILVTTILSARTKDEMTAQVIRRLFAVVDKAADLRQYSQTQLEKLIFPIGFFRTKAKHLRALPDALDEKFGGQIPETIEELCELPGVGRKTANLVRAVAFEKPAVCVDVHVHRICNRLGLICTKTPFETEMKLREILPVRYWIDWNAILVSYGQRTCRPVGPKCDVCVIREYCDRVGVK